MHVGHAGIAALALAAVSCSPAPSPPPLPEEVLALAERYDHPTAVIDPAAVRAILDQTGSARAKIEPFTGLHFIRDVIGSATSGTAARQDLSVEVPGSVTARAPCPGDDTAASEALDLMIGIDASRVQRAFTGSASECRFVVEAEGTSAAVMVTADLQIDVGRPLGLFDPPPRTLLIRASRISGSIAGKSFDSEGEFVDFRLRADGGIETLLDLDTLDLGTLDLDTLGGSGTAVLEIRKDGVVAIRVRALATTSVSAFSWSRVNLQLGVGYGNAWLPVVWLPTTTRTLVPDANFYVRF